MPANISINPDLLRNMAGIPRPRGVNPQDKQLAPKQAGLTPDLNADVAAEIATDQELRRALQKSRRIGGMLVKQEAEDLAAIQSMVTELSEKHKVVEKPLPCPADRKSCLQCFQEHAQEGWKAALKCAKQVEAYERCVSRVMVKS